MKPTASPSLHNFSPYNSDILLLALFIAAVFHVIVLLGINFTKPQKNRINKSIEISLAHTPLKNAPKQAKFLANEHQLGAGDHTFKPKAVDQTPPAPKSESEVNVKTPDQENFHEKKKPLIQKVMSQTHAPVKIDHPVEQPEQPEEAPEEKPKLSAETLQQQIAQLGERIRSSQPTAEQNKIKFVNSVSTHKFLAAQYVKDWEEKVERTGNLNYPEAARQKDSSQILTMDVGINADGSIYSMRIVTSSGNPALDEAAKRIVKMSAPFAELPYDLLKEVNVLVITRVWKFSDETGMTAR
jgi:protein TonB